MEIYPQYFSAFLIIDVFSNWKSEILASFDARIHKAFHGVQYGLKAGLLSRERQFGILDSAYE